MCGERKQEAKLLTYAIWANLQDAFNSPNLEEAQGHMEQASHKVGVLEQLIENWG